MKIWKNGDQLAMHQKLYECISAGDSFHRPFPVHLIKLEESGLLAQSERQADAGRRCKILGERNKNSRVRNVPIN